MLQSCKVARARTQEVTGLRPGSSRGNVRAGQRCRRYKLGQLGQVLASANKPDVTVIYIGTWLWTGTWFNWALDWDQV